MTPALRAELQTALAMIGTTAPVFLARAGVDRLFEGFVLSCLIRALHRIGATMQVFDGRRRPRPSNTLNLRRAPGRIYDDNPDLGFILVDYRGERYEVHTDLRISGTSKVLHELDLCVLSHGHAQTCRTEGVDPNGSKVRFLCECKCYGKTLPLRIGREFLGLCTEFHARAKTIASNSDNPSILDLVRNHDRITQFSLHPGNPREIDSFVGWLAKELQHAL